MGEKNKSTWIRYRKANSGQREDLPEQARKDDAPFQKWGWVGGGSQFPSEQKEWGRDHVDRWKVANVMRKAWGCSVLMASLYFMKQEARISAPSGNKEERRRRSEMVVKKTGKQKDLGKPSDSQAAQRTHECFLVYKVKGNQPPWWVFSICV